MVTMLPLRLTEDTVTFYGSAWQIQLHQVNIPSLHLDFFLNMHDCTFYNGYEKFTLGENPPSLTHTEIN